MKRYRVIITPFAEENIRMAFEWLEAENPTYAANWLTGIRDRVLGLETLPESHAVAPESDAFDREIRQLLFGRGTGGAGSPRPTSACPWMNSFWTPDRYTASSSATHWARMLSARQSWPAART